MKNNVYKIHAFRVAVSLLSVRPEEQRPVGIRLGDWVGMGQRVSNLFAFFCKQRVVERATFINEPFARVRPISNRLGGCTQFLLCRLLYILGLFLVFSLPPTVGQGQTFGAQGGPIRDFNGVAKADTFPIRVQGLPIRINRTFGLAKVCLSVFHARSSDIKVELVNPAGASIWLTNRNGGDNGQHYANTCFRSNGFSGYIHLGTAPFEGEYIPDGRFTFLNNDTDPNGLWYLLVTDLRAGVRGNLNTVSLAFETDPTPNAGQPPCSFENPAYCQCPPGTNCELLPDLVILPRFTQTQIKEYAWNDPNYPGQLRFAASIGNIGDGPLETWGKQEWYCGDKRVDSTLRCPDGSYARQRIYQRIYQKKGDTLIATDRPAGTNYYDNQPGHNHYHVDDWVEFRLVKITPGTRASPRRRVIAKGRKVSYCLFDSGICNNSDSLCTCNGTVYGERNLPNYGLGNYGECKSMKQGISVGGYDTYGVMYEGQFIKLPRGLPKGTYQLEIEIDPTGSIRERNRANNLFTMPIQLSKQ